jgi:hypothetical protein
LAYHAQQADQAEGVVAVGVGHKDTADFGNRNTRLLKQSLAALTGVENHHVAVSSQS